MAFETIAPNPRPFAEVKDLIEDIKKQGDAQLSTEPLAEAA